MFGLNYTVLGSHNGYDERQTSPIRPAMSLASFMSRVLEGRPLPVFGDGRQTRAFPHVDDLAPLIARAPLTDAARNQVINVGADQPYTILELAHAVAAAFDVASVIEHLPARQEVVHAFASHDKAQGIFARRPPVELPDGIGRMADWAPRGMPPSWAAMTGRG